MATEIKTQETQTTVGYMDAENFVGLKQNPIARGLVPKQDDKAIEAYANDILINGVRNPVVLCLHEPEGKEPYLDIVCGWSRKGAVEINLDRNVPVGSIPFTVIKESEVLMRLHSDEISRRHMTPSQLAIVVEAEAIKLTRGSDTKNVDKSATIKGLSDRTHGVSKRTVDRVRKLVKLMDGIKVTGCLEDPEMAAELYEQVALGKTTVTEALTKMKKPPEGQEPDNNGEGEGSDAEPKTTVTSSGESGYDEGSELPQDCFEVTRVVRKTLHRQDSLDKVHDIVDIIKESKLSKQQKEYLLYKLTVG